MPFFKKALTYSKETPFPGFITTGHNFFRQSKYPPIKDVHFAHCG
jgi:hypothetical protein